MKGEKTEMKDEVSKGVGKAIVEDVGAFGFFGIKHIRNGEVIDEREVKNLVVDAGKAAVAGLILTDITVDAYDYIAIGTGTGAAVATDTALGGEITTGGGERAVGTGTRVTTTVANDTAQLVVTFNFTSSFAVTESGMLNSSTGGDLLCRQTFSAVNVQNGDSLQITWKVAVS